MVPKDNEFTQKPHGLPCLSKFIPLWTYVCVGLIKHRAALNTADLETVYCFHGLHGRGMLKKRKLGLCGLGQFI